MTFGFSKWDFADARARDPKDLSALSLLRGIGWHAGGRGPDPLVNATIEIIEVPQVIND